MARCRWKTARPPRAASARTRPSRLRVRAWEDRLAELNDGYAEARRRTCCPHRGAALPCPTRSPGAWAGSAGFPARRQPPHFWCWSPLACRSVNRRWSQKSSQPDAAFQYEARFDGTRLVVRRSEGAAAPRARCTSCGSSRPTRRRSRLACWGMRRWKSTIRFRRTAGSWRSAWNPPAARHGCAHRARLLATAEIRRDHGCVIAATSIGLARSSGQDSGMVPLSPSESKTDENPSPRRCPAVADRPARACRGQSDGGRRADV